MVVSQANTPGRRKAEAAFWASIPGQAVRAFDDGDEFFSYEESYRPQTPVTPALPSGGTQGRSRTDILAQIESAGWRLQHANWVNSPDGSIIGIHLFRRDDTRHDRITGPSVASRPEPRTVLRLHQPGRRGGVGVRPAERGGERAGESGPGALQD